MRNKLNAANIDNQHPSNYPFGRIKDDTGAGDGTPVNEFVYGDIHEFFGKLIRLAGIVFNGLPDNEANGYQSIVALKAFANKNSYVYDITTASGKLTIGTKLGILQDGEVLWGKATIDWNNQTVLRGSDNTDKSITRVGNFKTGDYLRLVNTSTNIIVIRVGDAQSLDAMVGELSYLKAATTAQDQDGTLNTVATTPMGNLLAFAEWVNGTTSAASLASAIRNGLYPKEHFSIVANLGNDRIRNIGFAAGLDPGGGNVNQTYPVGGNISQCKLYQKNDGASTYTCTMANVMDNTNYYVRIFFQSQGNIDHDDDLYTPVFVPISTSQFRFRMDESFGKTQNIKAHFEVVQIS